MLPLARREVPASPAYDVKGLPEIFEKIGYSLEDEMRKLWELCDHPDPKIALSAQARWRSTLKDIRLANTVLLTMTQKDDGTRERAVTASALLEQLESENINARKQAQITHELHNAEGHEGARGAEAEPPRRRDRGGTYPGDDGTLGEVVARNTDAGAGKRLAERIAAANTQSEERPAVPGGGEGVVEGGFPAAGDDSGGDSAGIRGS